MSKVSDYEGVLIVGLPRSGTTLLRRLLGAHPKIHCPPETSLFGAAARFVSEQRFAGGMRMGPLSGLAFAGIPEAETQARLREFVFGFLRELAAKAGKPRWAEKTATDVFHLPAIAQLCGAQCRFIALTRHPLDAIASLQDLAARMQMYMAELHGYVQRHDAPPVAFAHAWVDANQHLLDLAAAQPQRVLRLRYEDLVRDPAAQLSAIFQFLGEPADAASIVASAMGSTPQVGLGDWKTYEKASVDGSSVGRGASLDPWLVAEIAAIVNPLMPQLGYEPIVPKKVHDAETARRLYAFGRTAADARSRKGE